MAKHPGDPIQDGRAVVKLLYLLARDHVPVGVLEAVLGRCNHSQAVYSNEHLARWAQEAADRLDGVRD